MTVKEVLKAAGWMWVGAMLMKDQVILEHAKETLALPQTATLAAVYWGSLRSVATARAVLGNFVPGVALLCIAHYLTRTQLAKQDTCKQ